MLPTLADAEARDRADPLRGFRARFQLPDDLIYLNGNSLGPLAIAARAALVRAIDEEWGAGLVASWNDAGWIDAPARVGAAIARLVGARAHEVIVADSTSVNVYKLLGAALACAPGRRTIVTEPGNFPSDLHVAQGLAGMLPGVELRLAEPDRLADALDGDVAVLMLSHVHYKHGRRHDMAALSAVARAAGALSLWDVSHSAGALPVELGAAGADLAVGCGYKYLNGGPGAPAFLYVREGLQGRLVSPITGWMGDAQPFAFADDHVPAPGIARFLAGTPPILALAALEAGVAIVAEAGLAALWAKACALYDLFATLTATRCPALRLIGDGGSAAMRGSHIAFAHPGGYAIVRALAADGVICDFRTPDVIRFGLAPLYIGFADIWRAVDRLAAALEHAELAAPPARRRVT